MKIEIDLAKELLEAARGECLKPVDESVLLKDVNDKFFNFGVNRLFHVMLMKLYEADDIGRGLEK